MHTERVILALCLTVGSGLLALIHTAQAGEKPFKAQASGSAVTIPYHFTSDPNEFTSSGSLAGDSNFGPVTEMSVEGSVFTTPFPTSCLFRDGRNGTQSTVVGNTRIIRFDSSRDLLYAKLASSAANIGCINLGSFPYHFHAVNLLNITGGTGQFTGASGTLTSEGDGDLLLFLTGPTGAGVMDSATETITGTIITP